MLPSRDQRRAALRAALQPSVAQTAQTVAADLKHLATGPSSKTLGASLTQALQPLADAALQLPAPQRAAFSSAAGEQPLAQQALAALQALAGAQPVRQLDWLLAAASLMQAWTLVLQACEERQQNAALLAWFKAQREWGLAGGGLHRVPSGANTRSVQ